MAIAYIDARCVLDRLDAVVGADGWQDDYEVLEDGAVVCRLRLRLAGEWVTKSDVGSESEQGDAGDRRKASFSDALKRAAVKWGIGRYLYRLPSQWLGWDVQKKRFTEQPRLPAAAKAPAPKEAALPAGPHAEPKSAEELMEYLAALDVEATGLGYAVGEWQAAVLAQLAKKADLLDAPAHWPVDMYPRIVQFAQRMLADWRLHKEQSR